MMHLPLPTSEIELLADWITRVLERETDDSGLLRDEPAHVSGRITVAAKELIRVLHDEAKFNRVCLKR